MSLLLIFTLGYAIGGVSARLLFCLIRAARNRDRQVRGVIIHDA